MEQEWTKDAIKSEADIIKKKVLFGTLYVKPLSEYDINALIVAAYWLGKTEKE
jgi:hypothetical protein